jgi:hypothetical protein
MSTKRTIINADEELVIKGKLTIEGNVTQIETTQEVTNLEGNVFTINSDGSNTSAVLALNSNGTTATVTFSDINDSIVVNKPIIFTSGNVTAPIFVGNVVGTVSSIANHTTTNLAEGTNFYFTAARARGNVSATDAGGDGSFSYDSGTGVFTYTGPSATEVRAHFSATNGIEYSNTTGVINLASSAAGNGLTYTTGVLAVGAGDGITVNADNVTVNNTVIRTTGDQTITGNTTFVGTTNVTGNIVPTAANTYNLGSWANHFDYVFANVIHAEYLDLEDANIADIHNSFYVGSASSPSITRSGYGLTFTHNASGAYYEVNAGDGLQISGSNVAVDNTVVRTTGTQNIDGAKTFLKDVAIQGNLDVTGNINSLTQTDLYVTDTKITLANGSVSNVDAYIYVEGNYTNDPYIKWDQASSSWKFSNNGTTTFSLPTSTTDLNEGNNLYFTTGRVNTAIDAYIIGGSGLTYSSGTIAVGAGTGITINADNVAVDSSVVRTTSNQSIAGVKTFTGELVIPSITSATANNSIFVNPSSNSCFIIINGNPIQLTADSDVGQVEDVGSTGINIYAGFRSVPIDNVDVIYHGIRSIDGGTYTTLTEASNVITVDANITAIKSLFSTSNIAGYGNLSYNVANGVFSYAGVTDGQIRGLFSGSGLISYDSGTGAITTTADNYGSWTVQTDSGVGAAENISSSEKLTIQGGTNITVTNTGNVITIVNDNVADIESVSAGDGLTGGGNSGNLTLNIGAGDGITVNTDNVAVNVAYVRSQFSTSGDLSYNASTGVFSFTNDAGDIESVTAGNGLTGGGTSGAVTLNIGAGTGITVNADDVAVNAAYVKGLFSATDSGGDGSFSYSDGVFTYTGPSQAEANTRMDAYLVGGAGLTYTSGTFAVGAGTGITVNANDIALTSGIVTAGTYGTSSAVPAVTVDTYGRVTGVSNTNISITASQVSNFTSAANTAIDNRIVAGSGLTYSSGTLAVGAGSYINVGADDISVNASTTATASTIAARDASGNITANVFVGVSTSARYADLAENYLADGDYLPGTVLVFGGDAEVTASMSPSSTRIAGVVTTQPAHVMNSHLVGPHVACIALRGRVPVKVMGVVRKGDVLVSAGEGYVGYATAALNPRDVPAAAMVGKAIGDKLDAGPGVVEALI